MPSEKLFYRGRLVIEQDEIDQTGQDGVANDEPLFLLGKTGRIVVIVVHQRSRASHNHQKESKNAEIGAVLGK